MKNKKDEARESTAGYKAASSKGKVPRLRFPEFALTMGWAMALLDELVATITPPKKLLAGEYSISGKYPVIDQSQDFIAGWTNDETAIICHDEPLLVFGDHTCVVKLISQPFAQGADGIKILHSKHSTTIWYIYQYLCLYGIRPEGYKRHYASLLEVKCHYPVSVSEQRKIAACLSSLDSLLAAHAKKLEALKDYKKGLMQRLFPAEGETVPRLRFPEFRNGPEWKEASLGDIAEIKLGKMLDNAKHIKGRLMPYLNNISLRWNEVDTSNLPQMYFEDKELELYGLKAGDVVICEGGEPGRSAVWDGRLPELKFQKAIHRVRFSVPFDPYLLVSYLEAFSDANHFKKLFTGGGIKHLTRESLAMLKVPLIETAEQRKITSALSSLDSLIAAEARKIEELKEHKRGLMQGLFPSPEEGSELDITK